MKAAEMKPFKAALETMRARLRGDVSTMADAALRKTRAEASGDLSSMPNHMADIGTDAYEQEFTLSLMPLPSHKLRLHVIEEGSERDLSDVLVRVGPWRCETDASGIANLPLGTGLQTLILWIGGYAAPLVNLSIDPDTAMPVQYQVAMRPELEANPDDNWTA